MSNDKKDYSTEPVNVTIHVMDSESKIIEQEPSLALRKTPHFVAVHIQRAGETMVVGMTFEEWQYINTKLYRTVAASMMVQQRKDKKHGFKHA